MTTISSFKAQPLASAQDLAAQQSTFMLSSKVAGAKAVTMERIDAVAKDFESQFISQMMESMFKTVDKSDDPAFGGGEAEEIFQSMILQEYGKILSRNGGVGVAAQVKQSMLRMQEIDHQGGTHATIPTPAA